MPKVTKIRCIVTNHTSGLLFGTIASKPISCIVLSNLSDVYVSISIVEGTRKIDATNTEM